MIIKHVDLLTTPCISKYLAIGFCVSLILMNQNVFVMKNLIGIILLGLIVSSCSLFQKSSMTQDQIDEMVAENEALKTKVTASKDLEDQLVNLQKYCGGSRR